MDQINYDFFCQLLQQNLTYENISNILKENYPGLRGLSIPSIKLFCKKNGLSSRTSQQKVNEMVATAVDEVGPSYGRKMMTGYIRQKHNINISETRIGNALSRVSPGYAMQRKTSTTRAVNPIPYRADYFGHKLHLDQNEKLVRYGVTHVAAIDGHSRFVAAASTMPIKNNITIYEEIYRNICMNYGMFHQIRVDGGKEFYLTLGMQEVYSNLRSREDIVPYRQTQSKQNLPIERFWPEVNIRVNYPIKRALVEMDNNQIIDMNCEIQKYCVSFVSCTVANHGLQIVVASWNAHTIPGRGKPIEIRERTNRLLPLADSALPNRTEAKLEYERTYTGRLTDEHPFGTDPLIENEGLSSARNNEFFQRFNIQVLFQECTHGRTQPFKDALLYYIDNTFQKINQL